MSEPQSNVPKKTEKPRIADRIRALSPLGILFTVFVGGAGLSTMFWSSTSSILQNDLHHSEAELAQIKAEFAEYRAKHPGENTNVQEESKGHIKNTSTPQKNPPASQKNTSPQKNPPASQKNTSTPQNPDSSISEGQAAVTVKPGETITINLSDDQLLISLIGISFEGTPPHYEVAATIGTPSYQPMKIVHAEIGDLITYNGKVQYEIRILSINSFSAKFSVKPK